VRTFEAAVRQTVLRRIEELAVGMVAAMECAAQVRLTPLTPPVVNDPRIAARVRAVARRVLADGHLDETERSMVSEDMAFFLQAVPGCFVFIGSANAERGLDAPHHNPGFDFDEAALPRAVALLSAAAFDLLGHA
jgi:amidohydrolase